jgi:hypothetical protein
VGRCVHFALEDLLGALHGQGSDLATQFFARAGHLLLGVGLGAFDDAGGFDACGLLGFVDDRCGALFGVGDALGAFVTGAASSAAMRFSAAAISALPRSAAARPFAILSARSSSAFISGGHTNFIVKNARMKKTTNWANKVAFKFTVNSFSQKRMPNRGVRLFRTECP